MNCALISQRWLRTTILSTKFFKILVPNFILLHSHNSTARNFGIMSVCRQVKSNDIFFIKFLNLFFKTWTKQCICLLSLPKVKAYLLETLKLGLWNVKKMTNNCLITITSFFNFVLLSFHMHWSVNGQSVKIRILRISK